MEIFKDSFIVHLSEHSDKNRQIFHPELELIEIKPWAACVDCVQKAAFKRLRTGYFSLKLIRPEIASLFVSVDHKLSEVNDDLRFREGELSTEHTILIDSGKLELEEGAGWFNNGHLEKV